MNLFYWHNKNENGKTLEDELLNFPSTNTINIATAFLSQEGVNVIRTIKNTYNLNPNNINVYISPEFSTNNPHILLEQLSSLCKVHIVSEISFHAKVYLLKGSSESKLIFGSSNLTQGGFTKNLEFDEIKILNSKEETKINMFFSYCESKSKIVDKGTIEFYKNKNAVFKKLNLETKKLRKEIYALQHKDDAFDEDKYDLTNKYFTYEDYETFFIRNQKRDDFEIRMRRKTVQDKILEINSNIYEQVKKLKIYHHWRKSNITSLITLNQYNFYRVAWMGVRYGKSKEQIDELNYGAGKGDDIFGFQKHACLQYCIASNGFEVNLFHAVKNGAVDRGYLDKNLEKLAPKIIEEVEKLKGEGCYWTITGDGLDEPEYFYFDDEDGESFINYYKKYDKEGRESFLSYYLEPDDEVLDDIDSISEFILEKFKKLLPLYNLLSLRM